jgi:hypothetical protein
VIGLRDLMSASCRDERRRAVVLAHPSINGIDFVEYEHRPADPHPHVLVVTFVKPLPDPPHSDPDGAFGLTTSLDLVRVLGGARIVGIRVLAVALVGERLEIAVDQGGDFSTYWLLLGWQRQADGRWLHVLPALDRQLSIAPLTFKAGCPSEFDCRHEPPCPPETLDEPVLDYLAKDYASFRRLLLDLIPQRNPGWIERSPADLGMALVELLAYVGDHLSYFQDAVGNEAYLDTARHRVSAKRHARLIDYRMHDGRNAWGFVQLQVRTHGVIPVGTPLLTRIARPLRGQVTAPGPVLAHDLPQFDVDPALRDVTVFESRLPATADPLNNQLWLHTWGNRECCLPRGATGAYLFALQPAAGGGTTRQVGLPPLAVGDYLVLEEVLGPATGLAADADPAHRQVVRLVAVEKMTDDLYRDVVEDEGTATEPRPVLQPITTAGQAALPLLKVTWRVTDGLTFPLCLSTESPETGPLENVSIARGNVVLCDHGRTVVDKLGPPVLAGDRGGTLELPLPRAPITFAAVPPGPEPAVQPVTVLDPIGPDLASSPRRVQPVVTLGLELSPTEVEEWVAVPDLLDSNAFSRHFVVDVDNEGVATARFGDDEYGRRPDGVDAVTARYRVGNGRAGNPGSESLVHIASPVSLANWPEIVAVRQPLPTVGGTDPETIEEVRQLAPTAFHAEQFRAVTEADYEAAALKLPQVAAAKCAFRWTGSWHTVFVAIHPSDPDDLITLPGGRTRLAARLERIARAQLTRYKLAGRDLALRTAEYVPLEITIQICVGLGHFRGDVLEAVYDALSNRRLPDGSTGFFHPSRFVFGRAVYLSQIYAAVEAVEGVDSALVLVFKRYWAVANQELENGVIAMAPWEIPRLDNDPNFRENGVLRLTAVGGL